ncbi:peptide-binding protein [Plantactinospora mayteni]|uniref:Peptide-binding protein n=1 Tax=Plantactinospora mayteni TaxID=566021 RepID=A0ABQ4ER72_9ACTN|nr:ABC transporter substrate-binding protein [Plantactinospora mayteni]GIG97146.1 peptide-binding protein [Plantactinospora mayteni]
MTRRVVIARTSDVTVLNPLLYADLATGEVLNRVFDHLVLTDEHQRYVPGRLVTHWTASPDGLVWDFFLRPAARWHDGHPVTADDAVFTFESILDPASGSARRAEFLVGGEPLRFEAPEPHVLRVRLPEPFAPLLAALAWRPVVARHVFAGRPLAGHPANDSPVGSAAFRFAGRTADRVVLAAQRDYHLGRPPMDEVEWRRVPDIESALRALAFGEADYVPGVPPELVDGVRDLPEVRLVRSTDASFSYLGFHLESWQFGDVRVRQAIGHAIDRDGLVREVLGGEGRVADGPIAPGSPWYHPDLPSYRHDRVRASALLDAAGWRVGDDGVRRDADGRGFAFTLRTVAGDRVKERAAGRIADDLRRLGIAVRVSTHPMAELLREYVRPRRFEAVLLALVPNPDPAFLHALYHSEMLTPKGWNRFAYRDREADDLLGASQSEIDPGARRKLIHTALERIVRDAPQIFLFHPVVIDAARTDLLLPALPEQSANRFMYLHDWDRKVR